ncbi:hypothetical protein IFM89_003298 [Coptis chinensis]|uniref:E3 ubiquitin-protein ligase RMA n=1 Tax=Coptis chinensis TaxID=261450 RepID=A0A835IJE6_9MAGN|nr:hypothetical protein IFM89_003298 [Coptis chinensis]
MERSKGMEWRILIAMCVWMWLRNRLLLHVVICSGGRVYIDGCIFTVIIGECPMCKGEVTKADITPIYGRGNSEKESGREGKEVDSSLKIPPRPRGRRSEEMTKKLYRWTP